MNILHYRIFESKWGSSGAMTAVCFIYWIMFICWWVLGVQNNVYGSRGNSMIYRRLQQSCFPSSFYLFGEFTSIGKTVNSQGLSIQPDYSIGMSSREVQDFDHQEYEFWAIWNITSQMFTDTIFRKLFLIIFNFD